MTTVLARWALSLALAMPVAKAGPALERAEAYLADGVKDLRAERFESALRNLEMAAMLGRQTFVRERVLPDALHLSTVAALRAARPGVAVTHAKEYAAWADHEGTPLDRARAHNDLVEALLALGTPDQASLHLADAVTRSESARDREESARTAELAGRLRAAGLPAADLQIPGVPTPGPTIGLPNPTPPRAPVPGLSPPPSTPPPPPTPGATPSLRPTPSLSPVEPTPAPEPSLLPSPGLPSPPAPTPSVPAPPLPTPPLPPPPVPTPPVPTPGRPTPSPTAPAPPAPRPLPPGTLPGR